MNATETSLMNDICIELNQVKAHRDKLLATVQRVEGLGCDLHKKAQQWETIAAENNDKTAEIKGSLCWELFDEIRKATTYPSESQAKGGE